MDGVIHVNQPVDIYFKRDFVAAHHVLMKLALVQVLKNKRAQNPAASEDVSVSLCT